MKCRNALRGTSFVVSPSTWRRPRRWRQQRRCPRGNFWLIVSRFDRMYQGSRMLRSVIGFGAGGTKLEMTVMVYDLSRRPPRPFLLAANDRRLKCGTRRDRNRNVFRDRSDGAVLGWESLRGNAFRPDIRYACELCVKSSPLCRNIWSSAVLFLPTSGYDPSAFAALPSRRRHAARLPLRRPTRGKKSVALPRSLRTLPDRRDRQELTKVAPDRAGTEATDKTFRARCSESDDRRL